MLGYKWHTILLLFYPDLRPSPTQTSSPYLPNRSTTRMAEQTYVRECQALLTNLHEHIVPGNQVLEKRAKCVLQSRSKDMQLWAMDCENARVARMGRVEFRPLEEQAVLNCLEILADNGVNVAMQIRKGSGQEFMVVFAKGEF